MRKISPIKLAVVFHETYERLAPKFGYETRKETQVFDASSPNGKLMIEVCREVQNYIMNFQDTDSAQPKDTEVEKEAVIEVLTLKVVELKQRNAELKEYYYKTINKPRGLSVEEIKTSGWWKSEFQYLLNNKLLSREELAYLFGQIKSIIEQEVAQAIYDAQKGKE